MQSVVERMKARNDEHAKNEGIDERRDVQAPSDRRERLLFAAGVVRGLKVRLQRMRAACGDDDPILETVDELRKVLDVLTADALLQVRQ